MTKDPDQESIEFDWAIWIRNGFQSTLTYKPAPVPRIWFLLRCAARVTKEWYGNLERYWPSRRASAAGSQFGDEYTDSSTTPLTAAGQ
jgi:hypothetical protein